MKRIIIIAVFALLTFTHSAFAWGEFGHKAIVELAKRHMTEKAKQNIAKYFSYDITDDAVYMDDHRYDEPILYTKSWHVYNVDENGVYDMNPRIRKGDAVLSIKIADYNLSNLERFGCGDECPHAYPFCRRHTLPYPLFCTRTTLLLALRVERQEVQVVP